MKEYILCASIWYKELETDFIKQKPSNIEKGVVISGWRHGNCVVTDYKYTKDNHIFGFLTSKNRFVDRHEAMRIAVDSGQVSEKKLLFNNDSVYCKGLEIENPPKYNPLFSEDLY
jgi:hypothetical protein